MTEKKLFLLPEGTSKIGDIIEDCQLISHYGVYHNFFGEERKDIFFAKPLSKLKAAMYNILKESKK